MKHMLIRKNLPAFALLVALLLTMSGCNGDAPACTHTDANADGLCDNCQIAMETEATSETTAPETIPVAVQVSLTVQDQSGKLIAGAVLSVDGKTPLTTDAEGKATTTLSVGEHTFTFESLPENVLGAATTVTVTEGMEPIVLEVTDNTPDGSTERPFFINEASVTYTFAAGQTYHFTMFSGDRRTFVLEGADVEVELLGLVHTPGETGRIEVPVITDSQRDHVPFSIKNTAAEAREITFRLVTAPGSVDNPIPVEKLGEAITAEVPQEGGIYYSWTATADGTLTVSSSDSINNICINNLTSYAVTSFTDGGESVSIAVKTGDQITVVVSVKGGDKTVDFNPVTFTLTLH